MPACPEEDAEKEEEDVGGGKEGLLREARLFMRLDPVVALKKRAAIHRGP